MSGVYAADATSTGLIIRGVDLGSCKNYSDGCNDCYIGANGQAACTMRACVWEGIPKCLDDTDKQILDKQTPVKDLATDFKLKTFSSCTQMEDVMKNFIEQYYRVHPGGYGGGVMPLMMEDAVGAKPASDSAVKNTSTPSSAGSA